MPCAKVYGILGVKPGNFYPYKKKNGARKKKKKYEPPPGAFIASDDDENDDNEDDDNEEELVPILPKRQTRSTVLSRQPQAQAAKLQSQPTKPTTRSAAPPMDGAKSKPTRTTRNKNASASLKQSVPGALIDEDMDFSDSTNAEEEIDRVPSLPPSTRSSRKRASPSDSNDGESAPKRRSSRIARSESVSSDVKKVPSTASKTTSKTKKSGSKTGIRVRR